MPKEYVYKLTLEDGDVQTTLAQLDEQLAGLGQRYTAAFNKVGQSLAQSAKTATNEAKRAVNEANKSQRQAEQAASRLEKQHIKLLAAELKVAAGADKAAQEFIKQAAAGASSADALAKVVVNATSLNQKQVQQAQTVAFLKNQITNLTAAMSQEGANTQQLTQRIQEYQNILARITASKEEEKAATLASAEAKRQDAEATAQQIAAGAATPTVGGPETVQAGGVTVEGAPVAGLAGLQEGLDDLSAEIAIDSVDGLRQGLDDLSAALAEESGSLADATQGINEHASATDMAATSAANAAQAHSAAGGEVEINEAQYKRLLAAELQTAAGADKVTQEFIKQAAAGAQTGDTLVQAVSQTDRLSSSQIAYAEKVAYTKAQIIALTAAMEEEGADIATLSGQIARLQGRLEEMNAEQEKAASQAQQVADNMADQAKRQQEAQRQQEEADKRAAKAASQSLIQQRKANSEFTKLAKSFPEIKQALTELTGQYGTFKTVIGGTGQATGSAQRELQKLFRDNPKFAAELRRLTNEYGQFVATINRADFGPRLRSQEQGVRQLGFALQRMGISGTAAFGEIFAALGPIGIAIGAIIVPIVAVTKALKKLANEAKEAFEKLIKDSFEAAKAFETTEAAFKAIFEADPSAVNFALRSTREESERLGVALEEILPKILPKVSDLDEAFQVAELIPGLAASAIDLGPQDALRSINEALAGDLVSLRKAFEIDITGIRAAQEELGNVQGLIVGLNEELGKMGLTFEDQSDTISVRLGQLEQKFQSFKLLVGSPIVDALKTQFEGLFNFIDQQEPVLDNIATMIGMIVANIATDIGETVFDKLDDIDPEDIERIANALGDIADRFIKQVSEIAFSTDTSSIADFFENIAGTVEKLDKSLITLRLFGDMLDQLGYLTGILGAKDTLLGDLFGKTTEGVGAATGAFEAFIKVLTLTIGSVAFMIANVKNMASSIGDLITGQKTLREVVQESVNEGFEAMRPIVERTNRLLGDYKDVSLEAAAAANEQGEGSQEAAEGILALQNALDQIADSEEEFLKKQEEINDKIREFALDAEAKFQDILIDMGRSLNKAAIDNARKLIDIETKNRQQISDIRDKYDDDIIDAAEDLSDKEADIARKHGRRIAELEEDLNDERLKAEQKYLDELERIRDKFNFDAFEAALANDAKRLAQLRRRQAFEEKQAKKDRDREIRDIDGSADDRRAELDRQLQQELEDARIANARKIRDLTEGLQEQLRAQEQARQREVEAQALAEKRKREDLRDSLDQQLQDYDTWWKERQRTTAEGILDDLQQLQQWVEERNKLLADVQAAAMVAGATPIEDLRDQVQDMIEQLHAAGGVIPEGLIPNASLFNLPESLLPEGADYSTGLANTLAELTREELEKAFAILAEKLDVPNLLQQQALNLLGQQAEQQGLHVSQSLIDIQEQAVLSLGDDELKTLIAELTAELAGIEFPELPAGLEDIVPEGFSFPVAGVTPGGAPQSGFFGATGGFGGGAAGFPFMQQPTEGYGFPPTLPADMSQFENFFLPGNLFPAPPTYGFDPEAFFNALEEETQAQAQAELEKRGEIADTVDLAALLAEERALYNKSLLDQEVQDTQVTSDAQLAILESTLQQQQILLDTLREQNAPEVDIAALETSIQALEDLIERSKEAQAEAAEEAAKAEVKIQTEAEEDKREEIDTTTEVAENMWRKRQQDARRSLQGQTADSEKASQDQLAATRSSLLAQGAAQTEYRASELEADAEHSEIQLEQFNDTQEEMLSLQGTWWDSYLRFQNQGIINDLNMMQQWLQQRINLWQQAQLTFPGSVTGGGGLPTLPGDGDGGGSTGGNQATEQELQNLALYYAEQLGLNLNLVQNDIMQMTLQELQAFVLELQNMVNSANSPTGVTPSARQFGGGFLPNQLLRVGEAGEEIVSFNQAGRVDPVRTLMSYSPPPSQVSSQVMNIDNSVSVGGFSFPDPRGLTPIQKAEMENIAANVVKKSLSGRVL